MTTQVYELKFKDGKKCRCIATEPATDEENMESIKRNMESIIESVKPLRTEDKNE